MTTRTPKPMSAGKAIDKLREMQQTREKRIREAAKKLEAKHAAELAELPAKIQGEDHDKSEAIMAKVPEADRAIVLQALELDNSLGDPPPQQADKETPAKAFDRAVGRKGQQDA